ncbi:MAG: fasciclin domain-containing protein, partial [Actinomycetota bacterium]
MRGPNQRTRRAIVVSVVVAMLAATAGITAASSSEGGDSAAGDLTAQNLTARNNVFDAQVGVIFVADVGDNDIEAGEGAVYGQTGGTVAPGLNLAADGSLTGVPTEAGSFLFAYELANGGDTDRAFVRVDVAERSGSGEAVNARNNLFSGLVGLPFDADVADNDDTGDGPITFQFLHGALPPGVEFTDDGLLTGTPSEAGSYPFRYRVTDSDGDTDIAWVIATITEPTIAAVATNDDRFSTLVTAVVAASEAGDIDFLAAISDPHADLTVFAPTNDAFAALGDTLDAALADPAGLLTDVLAYHVLGESQAAAELLAA